MKIRPIFLLLYSGDTAYTPFLHLIFMHIVTPKTQATNADETWQRKGRNQVIMAIPKNGITQTDFQYRPFWRAISAILAANIGHFARQNGRYCNALKAKPIRRRNVKFSEDERNSISAWGARQDSGGATRHAEALMRLKPTA